jgi:hypothetical protein
MDVVGKMLGNGGIVVTPVVKYPVVEYFALSTAIFRLSLRT